MACKVEIRRSGRKTLSVEVKSSELLIVRAPLKATGADIQRFLNDKRDWINTALEKLRLREAEEAADPPLTVEEMRALVNRAKADLPARVRFYASRMGVSVDRITIRFQKTRWGSCSSKGNLNLNALLMLCPDIIRDYVVVHELAHRIEMNHSPRFWSIVQSVQPDYKIRKKWLKDHGGRLIRRLP